MYITSSLTDAVGDSVVARLKKFPNSTFYDISYALTRAIDWWRLALVGGNVDRDFWIICSGGVCRSLLYP